MNKVNCRNFCGLIVAVGTVASLAGWSVAQQRDDVGQPVRRGNAAPQLIVDYVRPQKEIVETPKTAVVAYAYEDTKLAPPGPFPRPRWTLFKRVRLWRLSGNRLMLQMQMAAPIKPQAGDRFVVEAHIRNRNAPGVRGRGQIGIVFPIGYNYGSVPPLSSGTVGAVTRSYNPETKKTEDVLLWQGRPQLRGDTLNVTFDATLTGGSDSLELVLTRYLPRRIAFNEVPGDVAEGTLQLEVVNPALKNVSIGIPPHPFVNTR